MAIKHISAFTRQKDGNQVLRIAQMLHARQSQWAKEIEETARTHIHLLGWEEAVLWLGVSSGTWAQWVRLHQHELTAAWNRHFPKDKTRSVKIRIQPGLESILKILPAQPDQPALDAGPDAAEAMRLAAFIMEDKDLAEALRKLAHTLEGKAN